MMIFPKSLRSQYRKMLQPHFSYRAGFATVASGRGLWPVCDR